MSPSATPAAAAATEPGVPTAAGAAVRPRALAEPQWRQRAAEHEQRVDAWLVPHLERRRRGERHAVHDFLFTYYSQRPAQLRRWHPGAGLALEGEAARERLAWSSYGEVVARDAHDADVDAVGLDVAAFVADRGPTVTWVRDLLTATAGRPAQLGCFGLHEWAMVYRQQEVRHDGLPLRLGRDDTDRVVESHRIRCTHFDAFRFFTEPARPLNLLQPTRETQPALEQPGCLHASMDLYKWAYKLSPAVPSDLVADCFALAVDVRELDMRASPYDLRSLGYEPVPIETPEGKATYVAAQRAFADRAQQLRARLVAACDRIVPPSASQ